MKRVSVVILAAICLLVACVPTRFAVIDPPTRLSVDLTDRTGIVRGVSIVTADGRDTALGGLLHVYNDFPTAIRAGRVGGSCPTKAALVLASIGGRLRLSLDREEDCLNDEGSFHVVAIDLTIATDAGTIQIVDSLDGGPSPSWLGLPVGVAQSRPRADAD